MTDFPIWFRRTEGFKASELANPLDGCESRIVALKVSIVDGQIVVTIEPETPAPSPTPATSPTSAKPLAPS